MDVDEIAEPVVRPNGKTYQTRSGRLRVVPWADDDHTGDCGIAVFGTLDIERARPLAERAAISEYGRGVTVEVRGRPGGWYRHVIRYGEHIWEYDEVRGAPAVFFTATG